MIKTKQFFCDYIEFFKKYKKQICFIFIAIIAVLVRIYGFGNWPPFVNQDEASIGYDAWSILMTGKDRYGMSFPVHFVSWGSGQNALYAYLSIPFIAIFGLNNFSIRIVQLIFAIISVFIVYFLVKKFKGLRAGLFSMALLAISPWHIMLSHWGLESNILPALFLIAVFFTALATEKPRYLYVASVFFSLCLYSYGPAYLVVAVFALLCFLRFLIKKTIPKKQLFISAGIFLTVSAPIILFILVNILKLDTIYLGPITIPRLPINRMEKLFGFNILGIVENFLHIIVQQDDHMGIGVVSGYGIFYLITLPFVLFGILKRKRKTFDFILLVATVSSFILFLYYNTYASINNINTLYIPLIIYAGIGLSEIRDKKQLFSIILSYCLLFIMFFSYYFGDSYGNNLKKEYRYDFNEAISVAEEIGENKEIYFIEESEISAPYPIWVLYYNQIPPERFNKNLEYRKNPNNEMFPQISRFDKYHFVYGEDRNAKFKNNSIYIINDEYLEEISDGQKNEIFSYETIIVGDFNIILT